MQRTSIRAGQRLINWDGTRGYVALNSQGTHVFGPGEPFLVEWLGLDGHTIEDAAYFTLEDLTREGIRFGKGVMPWVRWGRCQLAPVTALYQSLSACVQCWVGPHGVPQRPGV